MINNRRLISSDDHTIEPPDLWTSRMELKYRDRAPQIVRMEDGSDWWVLDGRKALGVFVGAQPGRRFEEPENLTFIDTQENVLPGGWIPDERIKDMNADGVDVSVVYPTHAMNLFSTPDSDFINSCFSVYNDWVAEFCKPYPNRIKGIGIINVDDVQVGIKEMQRCAKLGLAGVMISVYPPEERSYDMPEYEPLWAAAQDLELPLSLHIGTNRPGSGQQFGNIETMKPAFFTNSDQWVRMSLAHMIFAGVFERYPKLVVGSIEMDLAWIPHMVNTIDAHYTQRSQAFCPYRYKGDMLPSDFLRRNVFFSFQEDAVGIRLRDLIGVDNLLWGSDYPHPETTFPRTKDILEEILAGCTEDEKAKITCHNAERIYGF